jgi:PadR family transcriptional regulator, regulatory protein PadR
MNKFSKELIGASAVPVILAILDQKESYGYEIMLRVKELSKSQIEWKEGSLYPVLHKLEKTGLIKSLWKMAENGRHRKYYAINKKGRKALEEEIENWRMVQIMLEELWSNLTPVE